MKLTGKNKKIAELADALNAKNIEISAASLAAEAMGHVTRRTHLAERYGTLVQRDFNNYIREVHATIAKDNTDNKTT